MVNTIRLLYYFSSLYGGRIKRAGYKRGMEAGKELGEKNQKIEIAKKLKEMGMKTEDIEKATNLPKEEIEKL